MGLNTRKHHTIYVNLDKLELMAKLWWATPISQTALWREALDDLLIKYGMLEEQDRESRE
jgi:hypothetical protein